MDREPPIDPNPALRAEQSGHFFTLNRFAEPFRLGGKSRWIQAATVILALVPIAFAGVYGYRSVDREMTEAVLAKREDISDLVATVLTEKFDRLIDIGISLSTRVRFRQLIENGQWNEAIKIMESVPSSLPYVERLFLADGKGVLRADTPVLAGTRGRDFSHRDWYRGVVKTRMPYISEIYRRSATPQINVVAVAIPIEGRNPELLGILVMQVRLEVFFEWFKDATTNSTWLIYIVDRNGRTAFHPRYTPRNESVDLSEVPAIRQALNGRRGVEIGFSPIEADQRVTAYTPVARYGWGVILDESAKAAFAARDSQRRRFGVIYGLVLGLGGIAAYLLLRIREQALRKAGLERLVAERTAELESVNKELETFSYSVSHDLRAPLRGIDGFSRILLDDCAAKLDARHANYLQRIRAATQRMGELIDDLLKLSRVTRAEMKREPVDLTALARSVTEELRRTQPQRHVAVEIQPGLAIMGDPPLLRIMLENLLGNAWKFTGKKDQARIEFGMLNDRPNRIVYYVRDNGAGFDMAYASSLFGAFQRLHGMDDFPGTGIGLATVQRIVHRHNGQVWAEGAVGQGASFYFTL